MAYKYKMDLQDLADAYLNDGAIKEIDEVYRKAEAYDKVSKAYEYYMPNDEQQHPMKLVRELNQILISNFRPGDFTMDGFTFRNYNDDLNGGDSQ